MASKESIEILRQWMSDKEAEKSYPFKTAARMHGVPYGDVLRLDATMPDGSYFFIENPLVLAVLTARELEAERRKIANGG